MKQAATDRAPGRDPFPESIEILRRRRRTVELSLEEGRLVARVPARMARRDLDTLLPDLRQKLWSRLESSHVFDQGGLEKRARWVAEHRLGDLGLPPFTVRFSSRQRRRWGSCTADTLGGSIRISDRLVGHPTWVVDHLLHHELIHLKVSNHGPSFQRLLARCPHKERAGGYLEALETVALLEGERPPLPTARVMVQPTERRDGERSLARACSEGLPLFEPDATTGIRD